MRKSTTTFMLLLGAMVSGVGISGAIGQFSFGPSPAHSEQPASIESMWAAAAPGRVEPKGRELHIAAPAPGAIKQVLVKLNDRVAIGDLLFQLDDGELKAKLQAVKAEAAVRLADRDANEVKGLALERRKAEDSLYAAERGAFDARMDLDRLISLAASDKASAEEVDKGRTAVTQADEKLEREHANLKRVLAKNIPALTREEAALAAARAEVAVVSTAL